MNEKPSRGLCCHEAGHAVVAHSFDVPVLAVHVDFTEQKGWSGGTDRPPGSTDHLDPIDQVAILIAGDVAEKVLDCYAHEGASYYDRGEISIVLDRAGIAGDDHWARILDARERAAPILRAKKNKVFRLADRLAEPPHRIERAEFIRLMMD